jgi:hypothetical protein
MMEIIGKILLIGGLFVAAISQIYIITFVFKINYRSGSPFILLPTMALVSEDLRKSHKIRIFLKLWGASLVMIILAIYILSVA